MTALTKANNMACKEWQWPLASKEWTHPLPQQSSTGDGIPTGPNRVTAAHWKPAPQLQQPSLVFFGRTGVPLGHRTSWFKPSEDPPPVTLCYTTTNL